MKHNDLPRRPGERLGFALYRIGREVARSYEAEMASLAVRPDHAGILTAIAYEGPLHIRALSRLLGINRQSIVNAVDYLENEGAIKKVQKTGDGRLVMVTITNTGRKLLSRIEQAALAYDARIASVGSAEQRQTTLAYLQLLAESGALGEVFSLTAPAVASRVQEPSRVEGHASSAADGRR